MKKILFVLAIMLSAGMHCWGQEPASRYMMSYEKQHHLYVQDGAMNVIDLELEWPELLNGSRHELLQATLQQTLFGHEASRWQQACQVFLAGFGTEVTAPLATLPDDDKFCYVTCSLKSIGHWADRYVSFLAEVEVKPHKGSPQKERHERKWVTYDLQRGRMIGCNDVFRMSRITDNYAYSQLFSSSLLTHCVGHLDFTPVGITMLEQVGVGSGYLVVPFVALGEYEEEQAELNAYLPIETLGDFLSKDFSKSLEASVVVHEPAPLSTFCVGTDSVYSSADVMPEFSLQGVDFKSYLQQRLFLPSIVEKEKAGGRLLTSFIVEKDGTLSNVTVLTPCAPSVDREVANLIRLMPRWKPGKKDGENVRVRQFLPLNVKL